MLRPLLSTLVLVMLVLQGMTQVGAHAYDEPATEHCAGHEQNDTDCACCDGLTLANSAGCAALCAVMAPAQVLSTELAHLASGHDCSFVDRLLTNPAYLPLTPPPIS